MPGLLLRQPGLCWTQERPGRCCVKADSSGTAEKLTFWEHCHTYPDWFSYHHHCVNQEKESLAAVLVKHNMARASCVQLGRTTEKCLHQMQVKKG